MDVSVHRFAADRKAIAQLRLFLIRVGLNRRAVAAEPFEIAAVLIIVGVLIDPAEDALGEFERGWVLCGAIGIGSSV